MYIGLKTIHHSCQSSQQNTVYAITDVWMSLLEVTLTGIKISLQFDTSLNVCEKMVVFPNSYRVLFCSFTTGSLSNQEFHCVTLPYI